MTPARCPSTLPPSQVQPAASTWGAADQAGRSATGAGQATHHHQEHTP